MKKLYEITYLIKPSYNLLPQGVQTVTVELTFGKHIAEAFDHLYNQYVKQFIQLCQLKR